MHADNAIPEFLSNAIDHGNQVLAAWARNDAENAARIAAENAADRAAAWAPVLATIHQATPAWVHPYIVTPGDPSPKVITDHYYDTYHLPAVIDLSALLADVPPIRVWAIYHAANPLIHFEAGRYSLVADDETGAWCVIPRFDTYRATDHELHYFQPGVPGAEDHFHAVLAQAVADRTDLAALQAEADRLNAAPPEPVEGEPVEVPAPEPVEGETVEGDPLTRIADALELLTSLYMTHLPY